MTKEEENLETIKREFPFIIQRRSAQRLNLDIGQWISENVGGDMVVISKKAESMAPWTTVLITYGFRYEHDAIAFKLRFGYESGIHWI